MYSACMAIFFLLHISNKVFIALSRNSQRERETETETETDRETERQTDRERQRQTEREGERESVLGACRNKFVVTP